MDNILSKKEIAKYIDHSLLKATSTTKMVSDLCAEARRYGFASVCVNPLWVEFCADKLRGTGVAVCAVIGFPLGAVSSESKLFEARSAVERGASQIDMVINLGKAKEGDWAAVEKDIRAVVDGAKPASVKAIIETCYLTNAEKVAACKAAVSAGAAFVQTSTGFGTGGATAEDVELMAKAVGGRAEVKASGGIRTLAEAETMIEAGARRIGASGGVAIVEEVGG